MSHALGRFLIPLQNRIAVLLIGGFLLVAAAAPYLAPPRDPADPGMFQAVSRRIDRTPRPPGDGLWLGTLAQIPRLPRFGMVGGQDAAYQWDVYYTLVWGTRSALRFGLVTAVLTATIGTAVGALGSYLGGRADRLFMRITDTFLAFPVIAAVFVFDRLWFVRIYNPWAEALGMTFTPWEQFLMRAEIDPVFLALVAFSWMPYARLVNAAVTQVKVKDYVAAAHAMGATGPRIVWRYLLPNVLPPVIVYVARDIGSMVVWASAYTFIGIGGSVAWGIMLVAARDYIMGLAGNPLHYWWTYLPMSLALILFGVGWNLLGDGLNTFFNPQLRYRRR